MPEEEVDQRVTNFREVALGYSTEEAITEAGRCLAGQIEGVSSAGNVTDVVRYELLIIR